MSGDYDEEMPDVLEERLEVIDSRRNEASGEYMISDMLRFIWNNPEKWEDGIFPHLRDEFDVDELDDNVYLVVLGIIFGTEYEYAYPRDGNP